MACLLVAVYDMGEDEPNRIVHYEGTQEDLLFNAGRLFQMDLMNEDDELLSLDIVTADGKNIDLYDAELDDPIKFQIIGFVQ